MTEPIIVGWSDSEGFDELRVGARGGTTTYSSFGESQAIALDNLNVQIIPEPMSSTLFLVGGATLGYRRFREEFKKFTSVMVMLNRLDYVSCTVRRKAGAVIALSFYRFKTTMFLPIE